MIILIKNGYYFGFEPKLYNSTNCDSTVELVAPDNNTYN